MNRYKFFFAIVITVMIVSACAETIDRRMVLADSLSLSRPDSAMMIMDSIEPTKGHLSRQELMRYELIRAKVQNRAYIDFTTDSVMKVVAGYYDRHGSANDRMMAHYLLGCTYRDLKEAPMALQCYYDAVEAADTLSDDCDYGTLMSIWGQIGSLLDKQYMPIEEMEAWKNYKLYALKIKDTLSYITGVEAQVLVYNLFGDTINILRNTQMSSSLYEKHGFLRRSACVLIHEIPVYIKKRNFVKAHELMRRYEMESGYFDCHGRVREGKEGYYELKGQYYEGIGKLDSAECFYRLLLNFGKDFEGCNGLTRVFAKTGSLDSLAKYSLMKDDCFDKLQSHLYTQTIQQRNGMYDYSRNQKIALQKENEALRNKVSLILVSGMLIIICALSIYIFIYYKKKKKEELAQLANKYISSVVQLNKVLEETKLIKNNYKQLQNEKEAEAIELKKQIDEIKEKFAGIDTQKRIVALINPSLTLNC